MHQADHPSASLGGAIYTREGFSLFGKFCHSGTLLLVLISRDSTQNLETTSYS